MKFGVVPLFMPGQSLGDIAVEAEELGYDGIWCEDHPGRPGALDTWIRLAYMAARTTTIKIGSAVTPVPRYVPTYLAYVISTLDVLSNGRVIAGLGAGYNYNEFRNYTKEGVYPTPLERIERFEEAIRLMLRLWTTDHPFTVNFKGEYYSVEDEEFFPKPVQKPHPPIWQGGSGSRSLRMAAKYMDGWIGPIFGGNATTPELFRHRVETIKSLAKEAKRDISKFTFASWGGIKDVPTMMRFMPEPDTVDLIEAYRTAGCQYWITPSQTMEQFAKEIIPSFK